MSISITLAGSVQATDNSSGSIALVRQLAGLTTTANAFIEANATISTSPVSITLPASPTNFLYVLNTHATNTVTVTWTPNGGSSNTVVVLQPGSAIFLVEVLASSGVTALSLTGSAASTTATYILGG